MSLRGSEVSHLVIAPIDAGGSCLTSSGEYRTIMIWFNPIKKTVYTKTSSRSPRASIKSASRSKRVKSQFRVDQESSSTGKISCPSSPATKEGSEVKRFLVCLPLLLGEAYIRNFRNLYPDLRISQQFLADIMASDCLNMGESIGSNCVGGAFFVSGYCGRAAPRSSGVLVNAKDKRRRRADRTASGVRIKAAFVCLMIFRGDCKRRAVLSKGSSSLREISCAGCNDM